MNSTKAYREAAQIHLEMEGSSGVQFRLGHSFHLDQLKAETFVVVACTVCQAPACHINRFIGEDRHFQLDVGCTGFHPRASLGAASKVARVLVWP